MARGVGATAPFGDFVSAPKLSLGQQGIWIRYLLDRSGGRGAAGDAMLLMEDRDREILGIIADSLEVLEAAEVPRLIREEHARRRKDRQEREAAMKRAKEGRP